MIIHGQDELEDLIVNGVILIDQSVKIKCNIEIDATLIVRGNLQAGHIKINNLVADNINALDITYERYCISRTDDIRCTSIRGTTKHSFQEAICGEIIIRGKK